MVTSKSSWDSTWQSNLSNTQGVELAGNTLQFSDWWAGSTHVADRTYTRAAGDAKTYAVYLSSDWASDITSGPCQVGYSINGGAFVYSAAQTPGGGYANVKTTSITVTLDASVTSFTVRRRVTGAFDMVRITNWSDTFTAV